MEVVAALDIGLLGLRGLVALVTRMQVALERVLSVRDRVRIHGARLHDAHREALHRACGAELVAAARQNDVVEATAGEEGGGGRQAEVHGERNGLVLVVLGHDLPHVRAGRDLERADVAPAEIHAVVADVAAAPELVPDDDAVPGPDGDLRLEMGMADREDVLVHVEIVGDDLLLDRGIVLADLFARDRVRKRVRELPGARGAVFPPKQTIDDVHVREEVRDRADVRIALDVVEEDRVAAVEVFLDPRELEVARDRDIRLHEKAFTAQPRDGLRQ